MFLYGVVMQSALELTNLHIDVQQQLILPHTTFMHARPLWKWTLLNWFDFRILFFMDSLNKTRSLFYIKLHEGPWFLAPTAPISLRVRSRARVQNNLPHTPSVALRLQSLWDDNNSNRIKYNSPGRLQELTDYTLFWPTNNYQQCHPPNPQCVRDLN